MKYQLSLVNYLALIKKVAQVYIVFTAGYVSTQLLHLHYIHYCYLTQEQTNTWHTHDGKENNSSLMSTYSYFFIIIMAISPSLMFTVLHTLSLHHNNLGWRKAAGVVCGHCTTTHSLFYIFVPDLATCNVLCVPLLLSEKNIH